MKNGTTKQKVVILPGPHKTGTTSVQSFLLSMAKKQKLGDWEWPAASSKAFSDVAHSIFFDESDKKGIRSRKRSKIQAVWKRGHSVVFGAELLDYVAAAPRESLDAAFERLMEIIPPNVVPGEDMTAVVMYRTPRSSHLISAWKQQIAMARRKRGGGGHVWRRMLEKTGKKKQPAPSLAEWLCTSQWQGRMEFFVQRIVASQVNPMGVARAFSNHMNVIVGDMSQMDDISNTIACQVLQVPCTKEGKIVGLAEKKPKVLNQRDNPVEIGFSPDEIKEVEDVLREMDCYYYCDLRGNLTILDAHDSMFTNKEGWNDCCTSKQSWLSPRHAYKRLQSIGCRASGIEQPIVKPSKPIHEPNLVGINTTMFHEGDVPVHNAYLIMAFPVFAILFLLRWGLVTKRSKRSRRWR